MTERRDPVEDPRYVACVELIGRTGAKGFQLRYHDDEQPVVWMAVGEWLMHNGRPVRKGGQQVFEAAAALGPLTAMARLCARAMDGGECTHCHRPSGVIDDFSTGKPPLDVICWYSYDPERQTFVRGCEKGG